MKFAGRMTRGVLGGWLCALLSAQGDAATLTGPLADTQTQGAAVWNVAPAGYVAEEYFLAGKADVYEAVAMADAADMTKRDTAKDIARREVFARATLRKGEDYTTRLIVYRPGDATRFSGNVIVETLHPNGGGSGLVWQSIHSFFVEHGDAYVAVQHPATLDGLKRVNATRYAPLHSSDYTQLWGMLTDTALLLRSGTPQSPLAKLAVRRLYLTGYSYTGVATGTFANYHHVGVRSAGGKPIFDGYLPFANAMYNRPLDVPVIHVNTQSDYNSYGGLANRREDSDAADSRYRLYELPGAPHATTATPSRVGAIRPDPLPVPRPPGAAPARAAQPVDCMAQQFPRGAQANDFPVYAVMETVFGLMYDWVEQGKAPPRAPRIATNADGSTKLDADGNAEGGLRLPQLQVPTARWGVGKGPCSLNGYKLPFDEGKRATRYPDPALYRQQLQAATQALVRSGLLRSELAPGVEAPLR